MAINNTNTSILFTNSSGAGDLPAGRAGWITSSFSNYASGFDYSSTAAGFGANVVGFSIEFADVAAATAFLGVASLAGAGTFAAFATTVTVTQNDNATAQFAATHYARQAAVSGGVIIHFTQAPNTTTAITPISGSGTQANVSSTNTIGGANTRVTTPVTDFDKSTSLPGLKLPSGDNSNQPAGAAAEQGMIRNDTEETVDSSDSAITHYNGTAWRYFAATESPDPPFAVDYLVVAGGGGGSSGYGGSPQGGGGAGGLRTSYGSISGGGASAETSFTLTAGTAYSLTVGVGGVGGADGSGTIGTSGGVSSFDAISTVGGGASRSYTSSAPSGNGGSGGGQAWPTNGGPGTGTINQGYAGGSATVNGPGAGGGGAGSVGSLAASPAYGIGGNGIDIDITGSTVGYAGGGGRTSGTPRGGGGISVSVNGVGGNGLPNTGGGGGGGKGNAGAAGGNGGSGVVILRYPTGHTASSTLAFTDAIVSGSTDRVITITGTGTGTVTIT